MDWMSLCTTRLCTTHIFGALRLERALSAFVLCGLAFIATFSAATNAGQVVLNGNTLQLGDDMSVTVIQTTQKIDITIQGATVKCNNGTTECTITVGQVTQIADADGDTVPDSSDSCPATPANESADAAGCSPSQKDSDNDGVKDNLDKCPSTTADASVDASGCAQDQVAPPDADDDGVADSSDSCPDTPATETADATGCSPSQKDSDGDKVTDDLDQCASTPEGASVDDKGCSADQNNVDNGQCSDNGDLACLCSKPRPDIAGFLQQSWDKYCPAYDNGDADGDGINNELDQCANTPPEEDADETGCSESQLDEKPAEAECKGPGYDCWVEPSSDYVSQAVAFPQGGDRVVSRAKSGGKYVDLGSASTGTGRAYITLVKGQVITVDLSIASDSQTLGRLDFGVTAEQPEGADLHLWISRSGDGARISNACSYVGYAETAFRFSMDDTQKCQLSRGTSYVVNLALCKTDDNDTECRSPEAMTAEADAILTAGSSYRN